MLRDISPKCEIHTFDMSVGLNPSNKPSAVHFHPWGVAEKNHERRGKDGELQVFKTLSQITRDLGHIGRKIDILKMDCEGCEFGTIARWLSEETTVPPRQIQVEVHGNTVGRLTPEGDPAFDALPVADSFFTFLQNLGYVIFHKEPNTSGCSGNCVEFSFLKLSLAFQAFVNEEEFDGG